MAPRIVVIGAGQAGASLVARLRSEGYDGNLTLVGAEPFLPYQRPPLSKKYLLGEMGLERLYLRPRQFYFDNRIELFLGTAVSVIDRAAKRVKAGADWLPYDQLVLTTGTVPIRLPGSIGGNLKGVYCIRTIDDVDAMAPEFQSGRRVLIIGGGYIGLEAAAVAAMKGMRVTLVEQADRLLRRVASPETAAHLADLHRSHGVDIRERTSVDRLIGDQHVESARLSDGSELSTDFVIVGVGVRPAIDLAVSAGLEVDNGIRTDELGRTSDLSIWAAGDCASFPNNGLRLRLESVPHAIDHAETVAVNILGAQKAYVPRPWFWSDQYDAKLQIAGLCTGYERVVTRLGLRPSSASFWYYKNERLLAVDAVNDPRSHMVAKRLIEAGISPAPEIAADPATDLGALLGKGT